MALTPSGTLAPGETVAPDATQDTLPPDEILAPSETLAPGQEPPPSLPTEPPWPGPAVAPNVNLAPGETLAPEDVTTPVGGLVFAPDVSLEVTSEALAPATVRQAAAAPSVLPRTPGFSFGCQEYSVWLQYRGGENLLGLLRGWQRVTYQYVRNGVAQATVTVPNIAAVDPECCGLISQLRNWQCEVAIQRESDGEVWVGPLVQRPIQSGSLVLTAYDMGKWLSRRWIHHDYNEKQSEALDLYEALWHDAIDADNTMNAQLLTGDPTGVKMDYQLRRAQSGIPMADQAISQAVSAAVDFYTVGRQTWAGAPMRTLAHPAPLVDEFVVGVPDTDSDGSVQANKLQLVGATRGNKPIVAVRNADTSLVDRDGLLEGVVTNQLLESQGAVNSAANDLIDIVSDSPNTVSQLRLAPGCPYRLIDIVPGGLLDVRLSRLCQPVIGIYRIQQVDVTVDANTESGAEVPMLTLQYVAPTMDDVLKIGGTL